MSEPAPWEIRPWSGPLTTETAERIADLIDAVLRHPCACVDIVGNMEHVSVQTSQTARVENGRAAHLDFEEGEPPVIRWSIGGFACSIDVREGKDRVRVSWHDQTLRIDQLAPAGHPLAWLYRPEAPESAAAPEMAEALETLLKGRDGLEVVAFIPIVWNPSSAQQEAASSVTAEQARTALRKAGRL